MSFTPYYKELEARIKSYEKAKIIAFHVDTLKFRKDQGDNPQTANMNGLDVISIIRRVQVVIILDRRQQKCGKCPHTISRH